MYQEEHSGPPLPAGKPGCRRVSWLVLPQEHFAAAPLSCCGKPLRCKLGWGQSARLLRFAEGGKKQHMGYFLFYQKWSWGSISDRRPSGVKIAWYSSYSQSAPPPHQSRHRRQLPQLLPPLHHRCLPRLPLLGPFCSFWYLPRNKSIHRTEFVLLFSVIWFHLDFLCYLSIQDAGWKFTLHSTIVGWIHPKQELPASGEWDGQRVKDFLWMDAGGKMSK